MKGEGTDSEARAMNGRASVAQSRSPRINIMGLKVAFNHGPHRTVKQVILGTAPDSRRRIPVLDGIDLTVEANQRLGVVGANGSGKTTLLKTIAGILLPTEGSIAVKGNVSAVIAQGLGVDAALSVRLNIRIGLAYADRLDEFNPDFERRVLDFAELQDFADEPLCNLSSGMRSRFMFALSLYESPEILLLDEVFATGDMRFVRKAREAMLGSIERSPITILVSHDDALIRSICSRCVLIEHGKIVADGSPDEVVAFYSRQMQ